MEKLKVKNLDTGKELTCLFNPTEYTMAKSVTWDKTQQSGDNVGKVTYAGGDPKTLNMELFFDVLETKNEKVSTYVDQLWDMTMTEPKTKHKRTNRGRPPICMFTWGSVWSFRATITNLSVRYTLFRADGTPVRAIATIAMQEAEDEGKQPKQNPTSYTEPGLRSREVRPRDTLPWIAFEEYGDATAWRKIAEANGIDDPLSLTPGQLLAIPR